LKETYQFSQDQPDYLFTLQSVQQIQSLQTCNLACFAFLGLSTPQMLANSVPSHCFKPKR
jgi:hypothetical protein